MRPVEPPKLLRSVGGHLFGLLTAALLSFHAPVRVEPPKNEPQKEKPPKPEVRIRVVQLPKPEPPKEAAPPKAAQPAPPAPQKIARPSPPKPAAPKPAPAERPRPIQRIAIDSTAEKGVHMRVLVPRSPDALASHLRNSGGCMVVSRLTGDSAEVLTVLGSDGRELPGPPCSGVPRLLRDASLNAALGDPIGRTRAKDPGGELVLQVLLTPDLHASAQAALHARFGPVSQEEMARRAAESGYELTCFAEPSGPVRCE